MHSAWPEMFRHVQTKSVWQPACGWWPGGCTGTCRRCWLWQRSVLWVSLSWYNRLTWKLKATVSSIDQFSAVTSEVKKNCVKFILTSDKRTCAKYVTTYMFSWHFDFHNDCGVCPCICVSNVQQLIRYTSAWNNYKFNSCNLEGLGRVQMRKCWCILLLCYFEF